MEHDLAKLDREAVEGVKSYLAANGLAGLLVYSEEGMDPYAERLAGVENSWPAAFYVPAKGEAVAYVSHAEAGAVGSTGAFDKVEAWGSYGELHSSIKRALDGAQGPVAVDASVGDARTDYLTHSAYDMVSGLSPKAELVAADGLWGALGYADARAKTISADDASRRERLGQLQEGVRESGADALVMLSGVGKASDVLTSYVLGRADGERSAVIVKGAERVAIVYEGAASGVAGGFDRVETYRDAAGFAGALARELGGARRVLYNPEITQGNYEALAEATQAKLSSAEDLFYEVRRSKTSGEVAEIGKAVETAREVAEEVIGTIGVGTTEKELYSRILDGWRKRGAEPSFLPLVAIGENAANIHHLAPTDRAAKAGDVILIDLGAKRPSGMCSDITYMVYMGDAPSDEVRAMDEAMDRAIYAAVDRLRVGSTGAEADAAAREVLSGAGYEDYRHGTGHALGFATHDVGAGVNGSADKPFKSGEVVTVEPGIYVEGWGGFRKEVDVVITEDGPVMLNEPAKLVCRKT